MADGEESSLTEAERRRVRRRQRILENQGARIDRILGGSSKSSVGSDVKGSSDFSLPDDDDFTPVSSGGPSSSTSFIATPKLSSVQSKSKKAKESTATDLPQLLKELSGDFAGLQSPTITTSTSSSSTGAGAKEPLKMGVQADGSVIMPKIPHYAGRIMICMLALFLTLLNAKQFAVTFCSLEVAYYFLNGLPPYPPPNTVLVALALTGVKELHLQRLKRVLHILDCVSTDFSLFLTFVMIPHAASSIIKMF